MHESNEIYSSNPQEDWGEKITEQTDNNKMANVIEIIQCVFQPQWNQTKNKNNRKISDHLIDN